MASALSHGAQNPYIQVGDERYPSTSHHVGPRPPSQDPLLSEFIEHSGYKFEEDQNFL
jgi:hypothetical protein